MTCADGHDVPTGAAYCPTCGSPVSTVSQPVPGWYADPVHDDVQRYWDGSSWTSQTAPASSPPNAPAKSRKVIVLAVAAAVVVLGAIVVSAALSQSDDSTLSPEPTAQAPSVMPAMDPGASQGQVIASLQQDFCGGKGQIRDMRIGYVLVTCVVRQINAGVQNSVMFRVYGSATALKVALGSGLSCSQGFSAIAGPSWYAEFIDPNDAAPFVDRGAQILTCGQN